MKKVSDILKSIPKPNKNRRVLVVYLIIFAIFAIPVVAFALKPDKPTEVAQTEVESITQKVGLLMDIPNETPTIASISDASKLRDQQFFVKAMNDDKVLIFTKAQKAILYRPSTNKIIEVALYKPPVGSTPQGQVAGAVVTPVPTAVPTKPFSLKDLIGGGNSVPPTSQPSPTTLPVPLTSAPTPTPVQ
jgi:hypothetical protein